MDADMQTGMGKVQKIIKDADVVEAMPSLDATDLKRG